MNQDDPIVVDRRNILLAAMMGGSLASLAGCAPGENQSEDDIWAGFDARITERTLAEAEKLFGLEFSASERQQILGGAVEEDEEGFFAKQVTTLQSRRSYDIPNSLAPATSFDPRLPGADYSSQDNADPLPGGNRTTTRQRGKYCVRIRQGTSALDDDGAYHES